MESKIKKLKLKTLIKNKIFWIVVAVITVAGVLVTRFSAKAKEPFQRTVQTASVAKSDINKSISATGTLSNSGSTDIEVPSGVKITKVLVSSGETVKKDQKLATVDKNTASEVLLDINEKIDSLESKIDNLSSSESNYSLKKTVYNNQITKLKKLINSVEKMAENGYIYSTASGVITNISEDSSSNSQSNTESNAKSSSSKANVSATNMNYVTTSTSDNSLKDDNTSKTDDTSVNNLNYITLSTTSTTSSVNIIKTLSSNADGFVVKENTSPQCPIKETSEYSVDVDYKNISSLKAGQDYTIEVKLIAKENYAFSKASNYNLSIKDAKTSIELIGKESEEKNGLKVLITGKVANSSNQNNNTNKTSKNTNNTYKNGNSNNNNSFKKNDNKFDTNKKDNTSINVPNTNGTGNFKNGNSDKSSFSAPSNSGENYGTSSTVNMSTDSVNGVNVSSYSVDMSTPFSLASSENVTVTVSVDELDINSVAKDQKAEVTIDAIEDGKYEGKVSKVSSNSTNSNGGNAKYDVDITLKKDKKMKQGMSASVTIKISEASNCLTLPVNAVTEEGDKSYVYTKDDGDGNLIGKMEVETGLSDGTNVEIKSGLSEGDTVYYTKIESSGKNSKDSSQGFPGGSGGFPGGSGGFPGGSGKSGGGFPGGSGGFSGGGR